MPIFEKKLDDMTKEELLIIAKTAIGIYTQMFGKKLPFVTCPFCHQEIKSPKVFDESLVKLWDNPEDDRWNNVP